MSDHSAFKEIYSKPGMAPWTKEEPPPELVEFLDRGLLKPGSSVLDIACGEGYYSVYMSGRGLEVLGIDFEETAIQNAIALAKTKGSGAKFKVLNALELDKLEGEFNFIFEWAIIHHLQFDDVKPYVAKVPARLKPEGYYMSLSFTSDFPGIPAAGVESL